MGGLQNSVIRRSHLVEGHAVIQLHNKGTQFAQKILDELNQFDLKAYPEYEIELLLRNQGRLSPVIVHGLDFELYRPDFLQDADLSGVVLGSDLAYRLNTGPDSLVSLISPSHTNPLLGDVPRQVSDYARDIITTHVGDLDSFHAWTRLSLIYNLIHEKKINRLRIYEIEGKDYWPFYNFSPVKDFLQEKYPEALQFKTWEDLHMSLVWALRLETTVMIFLFACMAFLIGISITSGLMIFFDKINLDLVSFWILGASKKTLKKNSVIFLLILNLMATLSGLLLGLVFLYYLDRYGMEIMPEVFVDRKLPVHITAQGLILSFFIPYGMATIFSWISMVQFQKDRESYLHVIRSVG